MIEFKDSIEENNGFLNICIDTKVLDKSSESSDEKSDTKENENTEIEVNENTLQNDNNEVNLKIENNKEKKKNEISIVVGCDKNKNEKIVEKENKVEDDNKQFKNLETKNYSEIKENNEEKLKVINYSENLEKNNAKESDEKSEEEIVFKGDKIMEFKKDNNYIQNIVKKGEDNKNSLEAEKIGLNSYEENETNFEKIVNKKNNVTKLNAQNEKINDNDINILNSLNGKERNNNERKEKRYDNNNEKNKENEINYGNCSIQLNDRNNYKKMFKILDYFPQNYYIKIDRNFGLQKIYKQNIILERYPKISIIIDNIIKNIIVFCNKNKITNINNDFLKTLMNYILISFYKIVEEEVKNDLINILSKDFNKNEKKKKGFNSLTLANEVSLKFLGKEKLDHKIDSFSIKLLKPKKRYKIKKISNFTLSPKEEDFDEVDEFSFLSKIKPKGLRNLGSCCYMNATLQCFFHIKEFTTYFLKNKKEIHRKKGLITNGLLDLFEGLTKNDKNTYYIPKLFKENLIEVDDLYDGGGGKDSGDLVETILTNCQEELAEDSDFPDFSIDRREERLMFLDLYYNNSQFPSIIMDLFNFDTRLKSRCYGCGTEHFNIVCENVLLFDLEGIYNYKLMNNQNENEKNLFNPKKKILSIYDCLTSYSFNFPIRKNVVCKYCNQTTDILQIRSFITLPKYFIMIMSRGQGEKFVCNVDFEEKVDLSDYYYGIKGIKKETSTEYSLLAGTILYGSRGYGHTVAFCKHFNGDYYLFNDSSVHKTSFEEIKKEKIYLLFYQKIN